MPGRDDGTNHLMLQCPDILPHSQRSSTRSSPSPSRSPDLSLDAQYHNGGANHTLPSSKSSSRHSVSFQLQNPDSTGSHQQDVLYDTFDQLLHVLSPGMTSPGHHNSQGPVWLNVPSTPTSNRRSVDVPRMDEEGKSSVVTFGYIEKANIHNMGGRRTSVCHSESDRMEGQALPAHLRKRLSDPVWYNGQPEKGDAYPYHPCPSRKQSPRDSPHLQRATLDAVARQATYKALEEFGSPELRRRFASHGLENCSPSLPRHYQSPRCRSLGGSPVMPRSTLTLPSKAQHLELDRGVSRSSVNRLPRSPATDHLCAHAGYSSHSGAPASTLHSHGFPQSQQRPWLGDESPRLPSKFYPPLPAGKPTDIQHEFPTTANNQPQTGYQTSGYSQHSNNGNYNANITSTSHNATNSIQYNANDISSSKSHYKASRCSSRASDAVSPTNGRRSISPSSNREVACKLAVEATKLCNIYADRRTPSPTPSQSESQRSESPKVGGSVRRESLLYGTLHEQMSPEYLQADNQNHRVETDKPSTQTRPGRVSPLLSQKSISSPASPALLSRFHQASASQSPVLDPRQKSSSSSKDASIMHRFQPPQYTGHCKSRGIEQREYDHIYDRSLGDSPEVSRKLVSIQNTDRSRDEFFEDRHSPSRVYTPINEEYLGKNREDKGGKMSVQGHQRLVVGLSMGQREEVQDHRGGAATSSQSSSGVTGSLGDSSLLDRYSSLSPETSSQSSHDTAGTGSGIQVG